MLNFQGEVFKEKSKIIKNNDKKSNFEAKLELKVAKARIKVNEVTENKSKQGFNQDGYKIEDTKSQSVLSKTKKSSKNKLKTIAVKENTKTGF